MNTPSIPCAMLFIVTLLAAIQEISAQLCPKEGDPCDQDTPCCEGCECVPNFTPSSPYANTPKVCQVEETNPHGTCDLQSDDESVDSYIFKQQNGILPTEPSRIDRGKMIAGKVAGKVKSVPANVGHVASSAPGFVFQKAKTVINTVGAVPHAAASAPNFVFQHAKAAGKNVFSTVGGGIKSFAEYASQDTEQPFGHTLVKYVQGNDEPRPRPYKE